MTQHIAVLGLETLEGRVVLSGVWGIESLGSEDYSSETGHVAVVGTDGDRVTHSTSDDLSGSHVSAAKTVIKTYLCPSSSLPGL